MFEDNRWRRMLKPGITAIVGAGGKTTVLERLGTYGHGGHLPIMVSSIVPMDSTRVDNVEPFDVICTEDMEKGESFCAERIAAGHVPAWFAGLDDQDRYIGLQPKVIDDIKMRHPAWYILIEGDAAGNKWLKAPLADDVPLPASCDTVIGVLNLQMLGNVISDAKKSKASKRQRLSWAVPAGLSLHRLCWPSSSSIPAACSAACAARGSFSARAIMPFSTA